MKYVTSQADNYLRRNHLSLAWRSVAWHLGQSLYRFSGPASPWPSNLANQTHGRTQTSRTTKDPRGQAADEDGQAIGCAGACVPLHDLDQLRATHQAGVHG